VGCQQQGHKDAGQVGGAAARHALAGGRQAVGRPWPWPGAQAATETQKLRQPARPAGATIAVRSSEMHCNRDGGLRQALASWAGRRCCTKAAPSPPRPPPRASPTVVPPCLAPSPQVQRPRQGAAVPEGHWAGGAGGPHLPAAALLAPSGSLPARLPCHHAAGGELRALLAAGAALLWPGRCRQRCWISGAAAGPPPLEPPGPGLEGCAPRGRSPPGTRLSTRPPARLHLQVGYLYLTDAQRLQRLVALLSLR
jgi:hypothetical protein